MISGTLQNLLRLRCYGVESRVARVSVPIERHIECPSVLYVPCRAAFKAG